MQLHYLRVVIVVSDVKVMSSTAAVIFAVNCLLSYYISSKKLWYPNPTTFFCTKPNSFWTESEFFSKTELKPNRNKKSYFHASLLDDLSNAILHGWFMKKRNGHPKRCWLDGIED